MSRGLIFMNPLPDSSEFFKFSNRSRFFPRSTSCHSRSLSPQYLRRRSIDALEIPSNSIHVQESIGKGYFGNVYRGQLRRPGSAHSTPVAIKSLKSEILYERGTVDDFLCEGEIMKSLEHPNLLRLLGICYSTDGVPSLVMPFMQFGDLRSYVADPYRQVCVIEVIDFSQQICEGMAYLSSQKIVHRDLAARNCMLSETYAVKIGDFGLAVDLSQDYRRDGHEPASSPLRLALKWLPIEVLRNRRYVHTTVDVWSAAVVMWELMTRACSPYDDIQNSDLEWFLNSGKRLPQPIQCPNVLYDIMLSCWNPNPFSRPRFANLAKQLKAIMEYQIEHARRHGRSGVFFSSLPCNSIYSDYYSEQ